MIGREIRFRARQAEIGEWHYFTLTDLIIGRATLKTLRYESWCEYTGLKDANRGDIYEGDILRCNMFVNEQDIFPVSWGLGGWCLDGDIDTCLGRIDLRYVNDKGEVIGNIYENPEMLK